MLVKAKKITIEFVHDNAGVFLFTAAEPDGLRIVVGGTNIDQAVAETVLVRALQKMVARHLGVFHRNEPKGGDNAVLCRDRPFDLEHRPEVRGGTQGDGSGVPHHRINGSHGRRSRTALNTREIPK